MFTLCRTQHNLNRQTRLVAPICSLQSNVTCKSCQLIVTQYNLYVPTTSENKYTKYHNNQTSIERTSGLIRGILFFSFSLSATEHAKIGIPRGDRQSFGFNELTKTTQLVIKIYFYNRRCTTGMFQFKYNILALPS